MCIPTYKCSPFGHLPEKLLYSALVAQYTQNPSQMLYLVCHVAEMARARVHNPRSG
jgi:hypothetical protein